MAAMNFVPVRLFVFDACSLLAYLRREEGAEVVEDLLTLSICAKSITILFGVMIPLLDSK